MRSNDRPQERGTTPLRTPNNNFHYAPLFLAPTVLGLAGKPDSQPINQLSVTGHFAGFIVLCPTIGCQSSKFAPGVATMRAFALDADLKRGTGTSVTGIGIPTNTQLGVSEETRQI